MVACECQCHMRPPVPVEDQTPPAVLVERADERERKLLAGTPTGAPSGDLEGTTA